jgi:hypothetical protein
MCDQCNKPKRGRGRPKNPERVYTSVVFKEINIKTGNKLYWAVFKNLRNFEYRAYIFTAENDKQAADIGFDIIPEKTDSGDCWTFQLTSQMKTNNKGIPQFKVVVD